uniref:Uncharacterized protein n=1 Tax=Opuntia streptacantha TaxID=393608 RepID=A0A7C9DT31_OPUST
MLISYLPLSVLRCKEIQPTYYVEALFNERCICWTFSTQDFKYQNSKTVHICFFSCSTTLHILWSKITKGTSNNCGDVGLLILQKFGQSKIRNTGLQVCIKQYVARLDISVNNARRTVMVQVSEPFCCPQYYI